MRILGSAIFIALLTGCSTLGGGRFPPPHIPNQPTADTWPDVGAAILEDIATLEYRAVPLADDPERSRLVAVLEHRRRIKILRKSGLDAADVSLPIDDFTTVTTVEARAVSPRGRITAMPHENIQTLSRGYGRRAPELKWLRFRIPGAEVGGLIEYRYERVYTAPDFVPPWIFADRFPIVLAQFSLVSERNTRLDFRYGRGNDLADVAPMSRTLEDGRQRWVFTERDVAPLYEEPHMPDRTRVAPWLAVTVSRARIGGENIHMETWRDVAERIQVLTMEVGGADKSGTPIERYEHIRSSLNAVDLPGLGVRRPVAARGLLSGEPACGRDAMALLHKALDGDGLNAYPALATAPSDPPLFDDFPALYPFTRGLVAVDMRAVNAFDTVCRDNRMRSSLLCRPQEHERPEFLFIDPLCLQCQFGEIPIVYNGGRALVLFPGEPRLVDIPKTTPNDHQERNIVRLSLDVQGNLSGAFESELTGAMARNVREILRHPDRPTRETIAKESVFGKAVSARISGVRVSNPLSPELPLTLRGNLNADAQRRSYEDFVIRPADFIGSVLPGRWRAHRRYPKVLEAPAWFDDIVAIELPVGYHAEEREVVKRVTPFAEYASGFARRERTLHYSRRLVLKQPIIDAADWEAFYAFIREIHQIESQGVRVWLPQR